MIDKQRIQKEKDKGSGGVTGNGSGSRGHMTRQPPYQELPPSTNKECRVCKQLEKQSGQTNLFLNCWGLDIHSCPKFVAMTQKERLKMAKEISTLPELHQLHSQ